MTLYWPQRKRDVNFKAAPADPGAWEFTMTQAKMALFHSPIWSVARLTQQTLESYDWGEANNHGARISAEEATEKFGLGGLLTFDRDITPGEAELLMRRKIAETKRMSILTTGNTGLGRTVMGFGTALAVTVIDPVNAASMFMPVVGQAKWAKLLRAAGGSVTTARLAKGAIEGFTGAAMVEPFILLAAYKEQSYYNLKDSAINLGFGAILGGAFQTGLGKLGDIITSTRTKNTFLKNMETIDRHIDNMSPEAQHDLVQAAISDVIEDRPVTSPAEVMVTDAKVIRRELKFDEREARRQAMAELGFDMNQPDTFKFKAVDFDGNPIPDPKLNEPWFHGRPSNVLEFEKGRAAWFTRDPEFAELFSEGLSRGLDFVSLEKNLFVANLTVKSPALFDDVSDAALGILPDDQFHLKKLIQTETIDALQHPAVMKKLKNKGFDSYIEREGTSDILVVFSPDQIRTPGRRSIKTDTGVRWDPALESNRTLQQRIKDLQKSRIKNLVARKRREFQKELALKEAEPPKVDDAHTFDKEGIDTEISTVDSDVTQLEESLGIRVEEETEVRRLPEEEQTFFDEQMRDFDNFDNDQNAIRAAIDCIGRRM